MTNRHREDHKLGRLLLKAERAIIVHYLRRYEGNRTLAAKALGVTYRHLHRRIKALKIDRAITDPDLEIVITVDD